LVFISEVGDISDEEVTKGIKKVLDGVPNKKHVKKWYESFLHKSDEMAAKKIEEYIRKQGMDQSKDRSEGEIAMYI
jgi:predicted ATP-binding protein involved in virulence